MRVFLIGLLGAAAPCLVAACSSTPTPEPAAAASPSAAPSPTGAVASAAATSSAGAGDAADIPRAELLPRLAKVLCEASAPCCAATGAVYDAAFCDAAVVEQGWGERIQKAKRYDGKSAARCLEEVRTLAGQCSAAIGDALELASCAAAFAGTARTGEPCSDDEDCAPPAQGTALCWTGASGEAPGRCGASVPPAKGAPCFTPLGKEDTKQLVFSECNDDPTLRCDPGTNTCGARLASGAACEQDYECETGSACAGGKCRSMAGAACKSGRECAFGQACIGGKCAPGKKLGEPCAGLGECADGMCAANTRRCSSWAATFLCKAPAR